MPDRQHDNRTHAAVVPITRNPTGPDLDGDDTGGEETVRQSGGLAAHSRIRAGDRRVHLSEREEGEEEE